MSEEKEGDQVPPETEKDPLEKGEEDQPKEPDFCLESIHNIDLY